MLGLLAQIDPDFVTTVLVSLNVSLTASAVGFVLGVSVGVALELGPVLVSLGIGVSAAPVSVSRWMQAYPNHSRSAIKSFSGTIGMD